MVTETQNCSDFRGNRVDIGIVNQILQIYTTHPGIVQICDNCGAILNNQPGFTDYGDSWTCTECGTVVSIGDDSNYDSEERREFEQNGEKKDSMTVKEAKLIIQEYYDNQNPTEDDEFIFIEAMDFLITEEKNPEPMMNLGGHYYEKRQFDLARKYYEMASAYDIDAVDECLGYIWYYGRCGEKDYDKYVSIIEELYPKMLEATRLGDPVPEVLTRMARIRTEQGEYEEAADLYFYAKDFLAQRIRYNAFFGNMNIMKCLIDDLYEIVEFDEDGFDFYDLYYLLKRPVKVTFTFAGKKQQIEAVQEDDGIAINFNGKWYRDRDDFFKKGIIGNDRLTIIYDRLFDFSIVSK